MIRWTIAEDYPAICKDMAYVRRVSTGQLHNRRRSSIAHESLSQVRLNLNKEIAIAEQQSCSMRDGKRETCNIKNIHDD
jgi:hypothetical protein